MRELLLASLFAMASASSASAADLIYDDSSSSYSPPYEQAGSTDWTGGYVGAFGGIGSGDVEFDGSDGTGNEISAGGGLAGVQAGYDVQLGSVVLGGVADIALTNIEADVTTSDRDGRIETSSGTSTEVEHLGTVRARAGYATGRVLAYGHGGLAYGETETKLSEAERIGGVTRTLTDARESDTKYGYVVGAGLEYKATDNVSIQTEYGYHDLGKDKLSRADGVDVDQDVQFHAVKAGLNFRF